VLYRLGYQIVPAPKWPTNRNVTEHSGYRLVSWMGDDGEYDVAGYRREQERGNRAKIEQVWTNEANLQFISRWLQGRGLVPQFILCHGTRNGFEQKVFSGFFQCDVIGTEISSTATQFPMTVQADFHEPMAEWDRRADIVYSNSLDHAYDPAKALARARINPVPIHHVKASRRLGIENICAFWGQHESYRHKVGQ